ncbi:MAG: hypothetical protein ACK41D_09525 [Rubricoccaceae bacterium]
MPRALACLVLLLSLAACRTGSDERPDAAVPTPEAAAEAMLARFEATIGQADTIAVEAAGVEVIYTRREGADDALDRFDIAARPVEGREPAPEAQLLLNYLPNVPRLAQGLRTARFVRADRAEQRPVLVYETDDAASMLDVAPGTEAPAGVTIQIALDAETYDLRELTQIVRDTAYARPLVQRYRYEGFQETDGLLLPTRVVQVEEGLNQAIPEAYRIRRGGELGFARQQLERLPPAEREAQRATIDEELRFLNEGVSQMRLSIDRLRVARRR